VERQQIKEFLRRTYTKTRNSITAKDDAQKIIRELFEFWMKNPERLPRSHQEKAEEDPLPRVICD